METIIGLGKAGCNIAEKMSSYPQYKVLRIDTDHRKGKGFKMIPRHSSHEEYEANCPSFGAFFRGLKGDCTLVVGGGGAISGISLRLLQSLKKKCNQVSVLYIEPEIEVLSHKARLQERVVKGVLQEYARSGALERIYMVNNSAMSDILGDLPILEYHDKINELLSSTLHMINVFKNESAIMETLEEPVVTARISTFGIVDITSGEEKLFYPLKMPREKIYYYAISRDRLESEKGLYKKIVGQLKDRIVDNEIRISYGIYPTEYQNDYVYSLVHATLVQCQDFPLD